MTRMMDLKKDGSSWEEPVCGPNYKHIKTFTWISLEEAKGEMISAVMFSKLLYKQKRKEDRDGSADL